MTIARHCRRRHHNFHQSRQRWSNNGSFFVLSSRSIHTHVWCSFTTLVDRRIDGKKKLERDDASDFVIVATCALWCAARGTSCSDDDKRLYKIIINTHFYQPGPIIAPQLRDRLIINSYKIKIGLVFRFLSRRRCHRCHPSCRPSIALTRSINFNLYWFQLGPHWKDWRRRRHPTRLGSLNCTNISWPLVTERGNRLAR